MRTLVWALCIIGCALAGQVRAQSDIVAIEYFFDTDPGHGLGTPVALTPSPSVTASFTPNTAGLSFGFHTLYVRGRDATGGWSPTSAHRFHYAGGSSAPQSAPLFDRVEFFVDADPGRGFAQAAVFTPSAMLDSVSLGLPLGSLGLSPGFHHLGIRARDANGNWTPTALRWFYLEGLTVPLGMAKVSRIEYFLDDAVDFSFGSGTDVPIVAAVSVPNVNFTVDVSSLSLGTHYLFVRTQDENNRWSPMLVAPFEVEVVTLPVTWLELSARRIALGARVEWSTASELNTDHFVVERRTNGGPWSDVGRAPAAGSSSAVRRYKHDDPDAPTLAEVDYRLRQVDLDGRYSHSPIVRLGAEGSTISRSHVLYPNPGEAGQLQLVALGGAPEAALTLTVLSAAGATLGRWRVAPGQLTATLRTALAGQAAGLYALRLEGPQGAELHRLVLR